MAELLSQAQIEERVQTIKAKHPWADGRIKPPKYAYVKPLTDAASSYIALAQNQEGRFLLGIPEIDAMTRGFGKGELAYVTGRAHAGKTQVVLNALFHNPLARMLFFTPDEVAELILVKLVALMHGVDAEEIERLVKAKDQDMVDLVNQTAAEHFPNLIVVDSSLTLSQMFDALQEARQFWGADADAVIVDFLELIPGEGEGTEGVQAKSQGMKRWCKNANVPVICLHQASRSSAPRGQAAGMGAMRYGGENDAIFVVEVFRKREDEALDDFERRRHENTLTVNLAKCKRPPCHIGEVDVFLDPSVGRIRPLHLNDMTAPSAPKKLDQIMAAAGRAMERAQLDQIHDNELF